MQWRYLHIVAGSHPGQGNVAPFAAAGHDDVRAALAEQVYACTFIEVERFEVIDKL